MPDIQEFVHKLAMVFMSAFNKKKKMNKTGSTHNLLACLPACLRNVIVLELKSQRRIRWERMRCDVLLFFYQNKICLFTLLPMLWVF